MAEGNGLLNRRTGKRPYRGFESRPLRYIDDSSSQNTPMSAKNKVVTTSKTEGDSAPNKPSEVPTDDSTNTTNVSNSDKPDNKPTDLAVVIEAKLPEAIRSAIVAIVRSSNER